MHWFNSVGTLDQPPSCSWLSLAECPRAQGSSAHMATPSRKKEEGFSSRGFLVSGRALFPAGPATSPLRCFPAGVTNLNEVTCLLQSSKEGTGLPGLLWISHDSFLRTSHKATCHLSTTGVQRARTE